MFTGIWTSITLILAALLMGMSFAHVLEMPRKLAAPGPLWLTYQHTLYAAFAYIGGPIEIGCIAASIILAWTVRMDLDFFIPVAVAVLLLAIAFFAVWLGFTNPANLQTSVWQVSNMPADWHRMRDQWEYSHFVRFLLHLAAFCTILFPAMLRNVPFVP